MSAVQVVCLVVAAVAVVLLLAKRCRFVDADTFAVSGLAWSIDEECTRGMLHRPTAVIVLELRGLAADTIVDGGAAWTNPIRIVTQRLLDAADNARIARIGPHSFGIVMPGVAASQAVAEAERLVAVSRQPIPTGASDIRIEAVAGICHRQAGEAARGEEMIREADACIRIGPPMAAPVAVVDRGTRAFARRVLAVESEIRTALDADLLEARLAPVVDVRRDRVALVRTHTDWTSVSAAEPATLATIANALGFSRSVTTGVMLSAMSASGAALESVRLVVPIDPTRLTDERSTAQISLLLDVADLPPQQLILELDRWSATAVSEDRVDELARLGVGIGLALRHRGVWQSPLPWADRPIALYSVQLGDLLTGQGRLAIERIEALEDLCGGLDRVCVHGVDDATSALELSALGLVRQSGRIHGAAVPAAEIGNWMANRFG